VLEDTGDLIAAREHGVETSDRALSLGDLVSGRRPGRTRADQITLYKSVGSGLQDLAVAAMCLRRAQRLGLGVTLPTSIHPVQK
jgi:ornithine cyclodeaminase/alanine dehydrogenase